MCNDVQVIFALVDQLDRSIHAPDRQELALFALRKLLVTDNTENISKPAAEAADAEGVPARLLALAQSGADFGGAGDADGNDGATRITARNAAALLADLTASTALLAATEGRPAQVRKAPYSHTHEAEASHISQTVQRTTESIR